MIDRTELDETISKLMDKHEAFYCFSNEKLEEQKKEGVKYVQISSGLVVPLDNAKALSEGMSEAIDMHAKKVLDKYGTKHIVYYELGNHEAMVTYEIEDTVDAVEVYGISHKQVQEHFNNWIKLQDGW